MTAKRSNPEADRVAPASRRVVTPSLRDVVAERAVVEGVSTEDSGIHYYRVSRPCEYQKTGIQDPHLIVVAQGRKIGHFPRGDLFYDENRYLVIAGRTDLRGTVLEASPDRPYLAVCISLTPDIVARTLLALADAGSPGAEVAAAEAPARDRDRDPAFVAELDAELESTVVRLLYALEDPLERRVVAPLVMGELVFRLLRSDAAAWVRRSVRDGDAAIERAMRFMRENVTRGLSVDAVARHVGMSPSHFAHRFTEVARVSPMRFLKQVRLEAARELLVGKRLRASEAATEVGYESPSHFTRDFKAKFGASPAEYARRVRA